MCTKFRHLNSLKPERSNGHCSDCFTPTKNSVLTSIWFAYALPRASRLMTVGHKLTTRPYHVTCALETNHQYIHIIYLLHWYYYLAAATGAIRWQYFLWKINKIINNKFLHSISAATKDFLPITIWATIPIWVNS